MEYRLLAMDMDGTVLNSKKTITPRTADAIRKALSGGKEILFATGRCPSEVRKELALFPEMNYAIYLSGALVTDLRRGITLNDVTIPLPLVERVLAGVRELDAMVTLYAGDDVFVEHKRRGNLEYFNCQCFAELYDECAVWVDDFSGVLEQYGSKMYKMNVFCHTAEDWQKTEAILHNLPLTYASGIPNNYEISPKGVDKGTGLELLCAIADIPLAEAVAVGDEGNDVSMLRAAGLGVAMGNASAEAIAAADMMTADCDHDGVAEVIHYCLL